MAEKEDYKHVKKFLKGKKLLFSPWGCKNKYFDGYQYWYGPFKRLFPDMLVFDPQQEIWYHGHKGMNQRFLKLVKKEKPDFIFLWLIYNEFELETLAKIRKISPNTKIINAFVDDDTQFDSFSIYYSLFFDYCIVGLHPNQYYEKLGIKHIHYHKGHNTKFFKPLNIEKKYDISFIGTPKADRRELIKYLMRSKIKIALFGLGWDEYPEFKKIYMGPLNPEEFVKVINQSKINLCFTKSLYGQPHTTGRVHQIASCKSFPLVEYAPIYLTYLKENKEIVMFKDKEDLKKKIEYYLKNEKERNKIVENFYKIIVKEQNLDKELNEFFTRILKKDKDFEHEIMPKSKKRWIILSKDNVFSSSKNLNEKIEKTDYIGFKTDYSSFSRYKNYLQAYSLEKSGKPISCCDYYVTSDKLGDFLSFDAKTSFNRLKAGDFSKLIQTSQLMVTKDYFLKNINAIKNFFENKPQNIFNNENTVFVSIPLVKTKKLNFIGYKNLKDSFQMKFLENLQTLVYNRKLLFSSYPYKLFLYALNGKFFILKYLAEFMSNKRRWKSFKRASLG